MAYDNELDGSNYQIRASFDKSLIPLCILARSPAGFIIPSEKTIFDQYCPGNLVQSKSYRFKRNRCLTIGIGYDRKWKSKNENRWNPKNKILFHTPIIEDKRSHIDFASKIAEQSVIQMFSAA